MCVAPLQQMVKIYKKRKRGEKKINEKNWNDPQKNNITINSPPCTWSWNIGILIASLDYRAE